MNCELDNGAGYVFGGGGGGGYRAYSGSAPGSYDVRAGGGGGAGGNGGAGVASAKVGKGGGDGGTTSGGNGTLTAGGRGRFVRVGGSGVAKDVYVAGAGGAAGATIVKNGKTVTITAGNDTSRIKGAVV